MVSLNLIWTKKGMWKNIVREYFVEAVGRAQGQNSDFCATQT